MVFASQQIYSNGKSNQLAQVAGAGPARIVSGTISARAIQVGTNIIFDVVSDKPLNPLPAVLNVKLNPTSFQGSGLTISAVKVSSSGNTTSLTAMIPANTKVGIYRMNLRYGPQDPRLQASYSFSGEIEITAGAPVPPVVPPATPTPSPVVHPVPNSTGSYLRIEPLVNGVIRRGGTYKISWSPRVNPTAVSAGNYLVGGPSNLPGISNPLFHDSVPARTQDWLVNAPAGAGYRLKLSEYIPNRNAVVTAYSDTFRIEESNANIINIMDVESFINQGKKHMVVNFTSNTPATMFLKLNHLNPDGTESAWANRAESVSDVAIGSDNKTFIFNGWQVTNINRYVARLCLGDSSYASNPNPTCFQNGKTFTFNSRFALEEFNFAGNSTTGTVLARFDSNNGSISTAYIEYGKSPSYGMKASFAPNERTRIDLPNLERNVSYYYRVHITYADGKTWTSPQLTLVAK